MEERRDGFTPQPEIYSEDYVRYVAHLATDMAEQRASRRVTIYATVLGIILAGFAFVGFSSITSMREDVTVTVKAAVQSEIERRVEREVAAHQRDALQEGLDAIQHDMEAEIAFIQFASLATELFNVEAFSVPQRDAAVSLLSRASQSSRVTQRPEFVESLENLVDAFYQADLEKELDDLDDVLGDIMVRGQGIVVTMVQEYGLRLAGKAEVSTPDEQRFAKYERAAIAFGQEALVLPFRIGLTYRQAGLQRNNITDEYFLDATHFEDVDDRTNFLSVMENLVEDPSDSNAKLMRAAKVFQKIHEDYAPEIEAIKQQ